MRSSPPSTERFRSERSFTSFAFPPEIRFRFPKILGNKIVDQHQTCVIPMVMRGEDCGEGDVFFLHRLHDDLRGHGIDDGSLLCGLIHDEVHVVVSERRKDSDLHLRGHLHERLG